MLELDALIASNLAAREVAAAKTSENTTPEVTPEHLEAIHASRLKNLKLDSHLLTGV